MRLPGGPTPLLRGSKVVLAALLLASCGHGDPFGYTYRREDGPLNPTPPILLTRNLLEDQFPAWTPDGRDILYSFIPLASGSRDRCIGLLPDGGGQIGQTRCYRGDGADDSTDVYAEGSMRSSSEIAWMEQHNLRGRLVPDYGGIFVGSLQEREAPRRIVALPYLAASGSIHATVLNLRWLGGDRLAWIGADVIIRRPCQNCKLDTVVIAKEVMLSNLSGGAPQVLPGSELTTSIWPTADSSGLYYTVAGDTRVWRRSLAGGAPELVHEFGTAGIVRDVSVVGDQLVAIVGGKVSFGSELVTGARQIDSGGVLHALDLSTGAESQFAADMRYRRSVLSPDGRSVVVEGVTAGNPNPNLVLYRLP